MASKIFRASRRKVSKKSRAFIKNSFSFVETIHSIIENDKNLNQKVLAKLMDKKESEISKLLKPGHNLTLKTISQFEVATGEKLIHFGRPRKAIIRPIIRLKRKAEKEEHKRFKCSSWSNDEINQAEC